MIRFITLLFLLWENVCFASFNIPFELVDNRVVVKSKLNLHGPFSMIFDTGSTLVVDTTLTSDLKIKPKNWFRAGGAGSGQVWAYLSELNQFELGPIKKQNIEVVGVPLGPIKEYIGFKHFDGTYGKELLEDYVIKINYEEKNLEFKDKNQFKYSGNGIKIPFKLEDHYVINAEVEGIPVRLWVDTGDRSNLTLFASFVKKHQFLKNRKPIIQNITGHGIGGPIPAKVAKVSSMKIGPIEISDVVTRFPEHKFFPYDEVDGSLGTGLLKNWNITFDKKSLELIFEDNSIDPQHYDRSGIWVAGQGETIVVKHVVKQGPGSDVDIKINDIIEKVNGKLVKQADLPKIREFLSSPNETTISLTLLRGNNKISKILILRDLI